MTGRAGIVRLLIATLGCATAVTGLGAAPATARAAAAPAMASMPGSQNQIVLGPAPASPTRVGEVPDRPAAGGARASVISPQWIVNYDAGFNANPAAKASFQAAVDQWSKLIYSPVPIEINASFTALSPGVLGSAGPTSLFRDFPGAPLAGTYYPSALANAKYGSDIQPGVSDINATFSSSFSAPGFYFGTDGNTAGKVDFESVVMHELGHGLGFLGVAGKQSDSTWSAKPFTYPLVYDTMTTGNGTPITSIVPVNLPTAMQGGDVRFTGAAATAANGGVSPKLYAPTSWQSGSSYSHLDESTYPAGNANSLMTPAIGANEVVHSPGPITLGVFADSGWATGGLPTLSMGSTRIVEGNSGARQLRFNVSISTIVPWDVSAHYATSDDTAKAPSDYAARTGTLTIPAGSARTTVNITVKGDTVVEPLERLRVRLSAPSGALFGRSTALGYIINDEPSSGIRLGSGNTSIVEGDSGARTMAFALTLSAPSATPVSVQWTTTPGTATPGVDYTASSGTFTFPLGTMAGQVLIPILPDTVHEGDETFTVVLSSPVGASLQRATGTATILNDD